jgi:NAD+ synthetase
MAEAKNRAPHVFPVLYAPAFDTSSDEPLRINAPLVAEWLIEFLRDEVSRRRGFKQVLLGLSGGVDSSLVAFLCARAFGAENVWAFMLPYKTSSPESLEHAQLVVDMLGIHSRIIEITPMVDPYIEQYEPDATPARIGNICARMRMIVLFDQSAKLNALPIGTGNKSERLFGYFTWHADDSPPINPLGDLFKTQVWQLARHMGVPEVIIEKPASADLIVGQTDEGDFGISYHKADRILYFLTQGYSPERLIQMGFPREEVMLVKNRVDSTHWKRHLPTTAMLSTTAIGEYYLRPVDF